MAMFLSGAGPRLILLMSAAAVVVLGASAPPQLAHIAGTSRKIRMYMVNSFLQLHPDGTVTGAPDESSSATVLQRSSVSLGQVKIQGVTTCMYLCMDICGIPYSSREFTDECVFNEKIEQHQYNTYSSKKYSNARRTLYLGVTRKGEVRRVQVRTGNLLGRLSTFTRVLTQTVAPEEAARHGRTVCLHVPPSRHPRPSRCRLRQKGRPRRRKKKPEDAAEDSPLPPKRPLRRKCEPGADCQRRLLIGRKRKSRLENAAAGTPRRMRHRKHRTAVRLKEEEDEEDKEEDDEEEEDVTMTTEDELFTDDHTDLFQDNNDNE